MRRTISQAPRLVKDHRHRSAFAEDGGLCSRMCQDGRLFEKNAYGDYVNSDKIRLLLHELSHVQQCIDWLGRENYADLWFGQLAGSTIVELFTNTRKVSPRTIHNAMPMEDEAEDNAKTILGKL